MLYSFKKDSNGVFFCSLQNLLCGSIKEFLIIGTDRKNKLKKVSIDVWLLALIGLIMLCIIIKMLLKRSVLLPKIKKYAARNDYTARPLRNCFLSVFIHDCKLDFTVTPEDEEILEVAVLTTPFQKVRYHFESADCLEIVMTRRGVFMGNP